MALLVIFSSWDESAGVLRHAARSFDVDAVCAGFQFRAWCGASDRSDLVDFDLAATVGCPKCLAALAEREHEVKEEAAGGA